MHKYSFLRIYSFQTESFVECGLLNNTIEIARNISLTKGTKVRRMRMEYNLLSIKHDCYKYSVVFVNSMDVVKTEHESVKVVETEDK